MRMSFNSAAVKYIGREGLLREAIRPYFPYFCFFKALFFVAISYAHNHQNFLTANKSLALLTA